MALGPAAMAKTPGDRLPAEMLRPDSPTTGQPPLLTVLTTAVAAESTGAATWLVLANQRVLAGFAALVAAVVMVGLLPAAPSIRTRFADRMLDRLFDACLLAAVAWMWRSSDPAVSALALLGLAASYLAAYERARGEGLGFRGSEATAYRAIRQGLLVVLLLTGWVRWILILFAGVTLFAVAVRASNVAGQERRRQLARWGLR